MDVQSRYTVVQTSIAERHAEAARARLVKGDAFAESRPAVLTGRTAHAPSLRERLVGLRSIVRRPLGATAGSPAR